MFNMLNEYKLIGKEKRICKKVYEENRFQKSYTFSEIAYETICYFTYNSDDIDGNGAITLYVEDNIITHEELKVNSIYKLEIHNQYIIFIMDLKDYYDDPFGEEAEISS